MNQTMGTHVCFAPTKHKHYRSLCVIFIYTVLPCTTNNTHRFLRQFRIFLHEYKRKNNLALYRVDAPVTDHVVVSDQTRVSLATVLFCIEIWSAGWIMLHGQLLVHPSYITLCGIKRLSNERVFMLFISTKLFNVIKKLFFIFF